jgi:hypothetical protein
MSIEIFNKTPLSEKDQLLDQLNALDKNHPDYQKEKSGIEEQLRKIADKQDETINAFSLQAEQRLAKFDKSQHNIARQEKHEQEGINKVWQEINAQADARLPENKAETSDEEQDKSYFGFYFNQLNKVADDVKKAIRSFNWRSLKQLSRVEKDTLCEQIDNIVNEAKINLAKEEKMQFDELTINRLINESKYKIQKIADDKHIKIPNEY